MAHVGPQRHTKQDKLPFNLIEFIFCVFGFIFEAFFIIFQVVLILFVRTGQNAVTVSFFLAILMTLVRILQYLLLKICQIRVITVPFYQKKPTFVCTTLMYLSVAVLNDIESNIFRFLKLFFFVVNESSDKWISAYALNALKVCVAMAQFLDSDAVSHCALV